MNCAIVGFGPQGLRLADAIKATPGLDLIGVVDQKEEARAKARSQFQTEAVSDLAELAQTQRLDAVCIATNAPSHAKLSFQALAHGARRLLIEKPMACSVQECNQIIQAAKEFRARVVVCHVRRYDEFFCWAQKQVASQRWGKLLSVTVQRPGIGLGCLAVHSFDLVRFLSGDGQVESVAGWVDEPIGVNPRGNHFTDPGGLVVMGMSNGPRGVVLQLEDGAGPPSTELCFQSARIRVEERTGDVEIIERDRSVKPGPGIGIAYRTLEPPRFDKRCFHLSTQLEGAIADLTGESQVKSSLYDGRAAVEVLVAAYLSQESQNAPVTLPLSSAKEIDKWLPVT